MDSALLRLQSDTDRLLAKHLGRTADLTYERSHPLAGGARRWLRRRRLCWRYRYVPGAPYPPRVSDAEAASMRFSWDADLRAALRNPPGTERAARRRR
jgi:hypothetical protein